MLKYVWKWIRSPHAKRKLYLEALIFLAWARILKSLPFSKVAPSLGDSMVETPLADDPGKTQMLKQISYVVRKLSRLTIWESACMVRAVAALKMLERRGIDSTLYLGTAKDDSGKMIAHAWLRSGSIYLTGFEEMERFTVVAKFGKQMKTNQSRDAVKKREVAG